MRGRCAAEELAEALNPADRLLTGGRLGRHVVERDLEPRALERLHPRGVRRVLAGGPALIASAVAGSGQTDFVVKKPRSASSP